jgi:acyl-coenzyme A synthetase/AMP-(fatty) acid ligase
VLAKFKVPKEVRLVDDLPHNAVGKILKAPLRDLLAGDESTQAPAQPAVTTTTTPS